MNYICQHFADGICDGHNLTCLHVYPKPYDSTVNTEKRHGIVINASHCNPVLLPGIDIELTPKVAQDILAFWDSELHEPRIRTFARVIFGFYPDRKGDTIWKIPS